MWKLHSPAEMCETRAFSSRYVVTLAPARRPLLVKSSWTNLPKRELLSLRTVCAQPNDSMIGFAPTTRSCSVDDDDDATCVRYASRNLAVSVLPAPDSPVITMAWSTPCAIILVYARAAISYACGAGASAGTSCAYSSSRSSL